VFAPFSAPRRGFNWPAAFAVGCLLLALPCLIGVPLSMWRANSARPDPKPLAGSTTPAAPVPTNRKCRIRWIVQSGATATGDFENLTDKTIYGAAIVRRVTALDSRQGFTTGLKEQLQFAQWTMKNTNPNDPQNQTSRPDIGPGEGRTFMMDFYEPIPIDLAVVDRDGHVIPTEQVAPSR
jgi:hypothetical protein